MPTPTSTGFRATVSRHAATLKNAIRYARSRASHQQDEGYAIDVAKKNLSSERAKAIEHVCALVIDLAHRGSVDEAESIGLQLAAIARAEHAARHPSGDQVELSRDEAGIAEQVAQGERENAEKMMDLHPCLTNYLRFLAASGAYSRAARALDAAVQRDVAAVS